MGSLRRSTELPERVFGARTAIGLSYSAFAEKVVAEGTERIDFVEIPFEQLIHTPEAIKLRDKVPLLLHCASLSIAGNLPPPPALVERLLECIDQTGTPWLGEHLAYVRADGIWREVAEHPALLAGTDADGPSAMPFNVGYTVSPQLSDPILERVLGNTLDWRQQLGLPVLLENGPMYFQMPGSTMSQSEFIQELCARSDSVLLLLDLSHLAITSANIQLDPHALLDSLPLDRVVEVHLSGMSVQSGVTWDDHSGGAPPAVFALLERLLREAKPRAITLEYNWDHDFPLDILHRDLERVRDLTEVHSC
ncbi:DUF692 family multinuclear iron-containing protein [Bradyrhizobium sp.]|uniref:multinuclear nonheme iron-dependent oxidase n=1 Tax=Bradyrhizobium sp. TaxID=376 RepID=UPI002E0CEF6E|nr:DUF692 family protein [Bradyrhizobium sp.]